MNQLTNHRKQLQQILKDRKTIEEIACSQLSQVALDPSIDMHFRKYSHAKQALLSIAKRDIPYGQSKESSLFWETNEKVEREVEALLKELKDLDIRLENVVSEQFEYCNELERLEEEIRNVLIKKELNHIKRAEPLHQEKQACAQQLVAIREQKKEIKSNKVRIINRLLELLSDLRSLRQMRMNSCLGQKGVDSQIMSLLDELMKDLQQLIGGRELISTYAETERKQKQVLLETNTKIERLGEQILREYGAQAKILLEMQEAKKKKEEAEYFQHKLQSTLEMSVHQINAFIDKSSRFIASEQEKQRQLEQIAQGIDTTNETIEIFTTILKAIQSEAARKQDLLRLLESLQHRHRDHSARLEEISEAQILLQNTRAKRTRLQRRLTSKIQEADVTAYRGIHQQIQSLQRQLESSSRTVSQLKMDCTRNAQGILKEVKNMNEIYRDILSEVTPQVWFSTYDANSYETSRNDSLPDLRVYLSKTFNRLNLYSQS